MLCFLCKKYVLPQSNRWSLFPGCTVIDSPMSQSGGRAGSTSTNGVRPQCFSVGCCSALTQKRCFRRSGSEDGDSNGRTVFLGPPAAFSTRRTSESAVSIVVGLGSVLSTQEARTGRYGGIIFPPGSKCTCHPEQSWSGLRCAIGPKSCQNVPTLFQWSHRN